MWGGVVPPMILDLMCCRILNRKRRSIRPGFTTNETDFLFIFFSEMTGLFLPVTSLNCGMTWALPEGPEAGRYSGDESLSTTRRCSMSPNQPSPDQCFYYDDLSI